ANVMVAQISMFLSCICGTRLAGANEVAEPKCHQTYTPITPRISTGNHIPTDAMLWSHLPRFRPTTFRTVMNASSPSDDKMKNGWLLARCGARAPNTNSALLAVK